MYTDITGVILAGGRSRRMGVNKALLEIDGVTVIERMARLLKEIFSEVILITNTPEEYAFLQLKMHPDIYLNKGPLAGIHSALLNSQTEKNFIISCDIPFMTAEVIKDMINIRTAEPVTVVRADGYIQQLAGLYHKKVLPAAEELLSGEYESKKCRVLSLIDKCGAEIIEADTLPSCRKDTFFNMNSREDYEKALSCTDEPNPRTDSLT